ncbi:DUF6174 domain-containing protein [Nostoc parmelioides]|uniref:Uncharacterized protein n=1 Tax=Nostoc parmelioides FACHB-3921 TaxID=2692909 RepID=A0ABR8BGH1_9NOSO|nr:DUF6174 domain-containing protein [Nostoc parmelioides]MBD2252157.1 hypothetical protein [Nostoc parmelioides FACHB-3921]
MNKRSSLEGIIIISILTISSIAYLSNQFIFKNAAKKQLAVAQKNWLKQGILHYKITINYLSPNKCQQEVEIKNETVVAIKKNTCTTIPPLTITEMFKEIELLATGKECGPNGCACDGTIGVDATYDDQFGYPRRVAIKLQPEKRWLHFNSLSDIYPGRNCTLVGYINKRIIVRDFTPLDNETFIPN